MKTKKLKVEISTKKLQEIAEFYEFPLAVFFMPEGSLPKGTRRQLFSKKADAFNRISEIVHEVENEM